MFNCTKLDNGLHVLSYKMDYLNTVSISLIVKVGSRYEKSSLSGISHFIEHMAFKGTKTRTAQDIAKEFDLIGGRFNAYTSKEYTVYYAKVLSQHLKIALNIIADVVQNSIFETNEIKKEYQVICQEIAQKNDSPDELAFEKLSKCAFLNQQIGESILGTEDTINKFTTNTFTGYIKQFYTANNIFISVAGKVNHNNLTELCNELFRKLKSKDISAYSKAKYLGDHYYIDKDLEQTTFFLGFEGIPYKNKQEYYCAQLLSNILGGGISSRLFQTIREKYGLAYSVGSFNNSYYDAGIFCLYASTSHNNAQKTIDILIQETQKILFDIKEEEIDLVKSQIKANLIMSEESSSAKSESIGKNFIIFNKFFALKKIVSEIEQIDINKIQKITEKIFKSRISFSGIGPSASKLNCPVYIENK